MNKQMPTMNREVRRERLLFACVQSGLEGAVVLNDTLSDPHNGGQCAALFACGGKKYIYKPRSGAADFAWADFLDAMGKLTDAELPRAVRPVSPKDAEYTIVPFAEGREAASIEEVRCYYRRCGALLALCMVLGATDMHSENMIADGDSPLLVDVETLMAGVTSDQADPSERLYGLLIFSHLLPNWMLTDGENVDVGALTGEGRNRLYRNGMPCLAYEYAQEICTGFGRTYEAILRSKVQVSRALECFAHAPFRKLLRPTDLYARLCRQIERLESEADRRASAERLRRAYLRGGTEWAEKMSRVCDSEAEAVLRGDIPYFFSYGDERCLRDIGGAAAEDYFVLSPLEAARRRLEALRAEDGEDQEKIIRQSLRAVRPEAERRAVTAAAQVFDMLEENAVRGCPSVWMGLSEGGRGEAYFQSIGFDLYGGLSGVLVFYGALYEAFEDERALEALRRHYAAYRSRYVENGHVLRANADNISLTDGLGGHIHALGYLARAARDEAYLRDAVRLFLRFDFEGYSDRERWDVYGGAGGLLTALPLLKGCGTDDGLAETAVRLADGICHAEAELTGYAHGAAGLALALGAAQYVSGKDYTQDILRLLRWENGHFDESRNNWPDLRDAQKKGFMKGLCSGAPGIGIARVQLMRYVKDARVRAICAEDICRVRSFLRAQGERLRRDTLCCGNAALAEAERILCGEVRRERLNEAPTLYHMLGTDDFGAGLFQGWAGVGYALARQAPKAASSLFVWEVES